MKNQFNTNQFAAFLAIFIMCLIAAACDLLGAASNDGPHYDADAFIVGLASFMLVGAYFTCKPVTTAYDKPLVYANGPLHEDWLGGDYTLVDVSQASTQHPDHDDQMRYAMRGCPDESLWLEKE